jgi:DNA-binding beta-propeller fold protein YncE
MAQRSIWSTFAGIVLLAVLACFGGCAEPDTRLSLPAADLVWPDGEGEIARIRYVASVARPEDLQIRKSGWKRFWHYLIGEEEQPMVTPFGITVDDAGRIYVVDTYWKNIRVLDRNARRSFIFPDEEVELVFPVDVVVDGEDGMIYISDSQAGVVRGFRDPEDSAPLIIGEGNLKRPTGLAINRKTGELLVVDTSQHAVLRFSLRNHLLTGRFGLRGQGEGELNFPTGISAGNDGGCHVVDAMNFRVQTFTGNGGLLSQFGGPGDGPGTFSRPRDVAVDSEGNIYVVDAIFDNVQIFDAVGRLLLAFGRPGHGDGEFWLPAGISIDKDDNIYIADSYNHRIQIFSYLKQEDVQ